MTIECSWWERVSAAADGELDDDETAAALDHASRCSRCGPLLENTPEVHRRPFVAVDPLPDAALSAPERRWLRGGWSRWALVAAAVVIVAGAVPAYATGHGLDSQAHAARHLATWQIGFGVGLLVAAWVSRLSHAMLALAATSALLTIVATVIDLIEGHSGPLAESVHLVEVIAVFLLWRITPPHLLPWHKTSTFSRSHSIKPVEGTDLRVVPPTPGRRSKPAP